MDDQNEFFSVYGEGRSYAKQRQQGLKLLRASIRGTTASWSFVGVVLAGSLTLVALWTVQRAHAGAQFVIQRFTH
jgi:hypothetical protein